MSQYNHRMTLAVPQSLMPQANQLALIAGESPDDVNTFTNANWQDADGNLYAVCSTVIKPNVLAMFGMPVTDSGLDEYGADLDLAQEAMSAAVMYEEGVKATPNTIVIAIDVDPMTALKTLGLTQVITDTDEV